MSNRLARRLRSKPPGCINRHFDHPQRGAARWWQHDHSQGRKGSIVAGALHPV